jgi:cation diffusion facilitator CzcD-associated flavoprotein CzcO
MGYYENDYCYQVILAQVDLILMPSAAISPPDSIDIAIIGAGPHALTLVTHLLQKRQSMRERLWVLDPSGIWMQQWHRQFTALDIPHLRSPAAHHPDPNPAALRTFAECRHQELFCPYDLPGTQLFADFCQTLIRRWQLSERILPVQVQQIEPITHRSRPCFRLGLADGGCILARRVVLAMGGGSAHLPDWVNRISQPYPPERLQHSQQIDLRCLRWAGEQILIVGGGLTSAHLAVGALVRGARVSLLVRRPLQEKLFDAEPGWSAPKYLKGFQAEPDSQKRWQIIQQARNGGSIPPAMMMVLRRYQRQGQLAIDEQTEITDADWLDHRWQIRCQGGKQLKGDYLWLATGTHLDAMAQPLLQPVLAAHPNVMVNGLPVLDTHLRWRGCELYLMGGYAGLQVGPVAQNLAGARMASKRIVPALVKSQSAWFMV